MTAVSDAAAQAAIGAAARELKLPTVRDQAARLAEIAAREHSTYLAYLAEVLAAELDDRSARRRARRTRQGGTTSSRSARVRAGSSRRRVVSRRRISRRRT